MTSGGFLTENHIVEPISRVKFQQEKDKNPPSFPLIFAHFGHRDVVLNNFHRTCVFGLTRGCLLAEFPSAGEAVFQPTNPPKVQVLTVKQTCEYPSGNVLMLRKVN